MTAILEQLMADDAKVLEYQRAYRDPDPAKLEALRATRDAAREAKALASFLANRAKMQAKQATRRTTREATRQQRAARADPVKLEAQRVIRQATQEAKFEERRLTLLATQEARRATREAKAQAKFEANRQAMQAKGEARQAKWETQQANRQATHEATRLKARESGRRLRMLEAALVEANAAARAARGGADPTPEQLTASRRIGEALAAHRLTPPVQPMPAR